MTQERKYDPSELSLLAGLLNGPEGGRFQAPSPLLAAARGPKVRSRSLQRDRPAAAAAGRLAAGGTPAVALEQVGRCGDSSAWPLLQVGEEV